MGSPPTRHLFGSFLFEKTVDEIQTQVRTKIEQVKAKISAREIRIVRLREEYAITDSDMITLLTQAAQEAASNRQVSMSYSLASQNSDTRIIGAGVVQNLLTEKQLIEQEKEAVVRLELITRNLRPLTHHTNDTGTLYKQNTFILTEADIEYLGF